jgi:hypothetical protein
MSPQKQAAQIANAQKSHGPATEAGRARSSQNSVRHSLCSKKYFIVPEDRPEFDLYYNDLIGALAPEGALEAKLAEAIIMDEWRLTRARQVENQIFCRGYMSAKPEDQFISGAETWLAHSKELATLTLYEQRINRLLSRNKAEFSSLQGTRRGAGLPACALSTTQSRPAEPAQAVSQRVETAPPEQPAGFVYSSEAPSSAPDAQSLTPHCEATPQSGGFVRSSSSIATIEQPVMHMEQPLATVESVPSPPAVSRRAA